MYAPLKTLRVGPGGIAGHDILDVERNADDTVTLSVSSSTTARQGITLNRDQVEWLADAMGLTPARPKDTDVAYLAQVGEVISLENGAELVWVPQPLAESVDFLPTYDEIQAWANDPEAGIVVVDVAGMFDE